MKYIVIRREGKTITQELPIIFPSHLIHKDVANAIINLLQKENGAWTSITAVAAGEYTPMTGQCSGKSVTLGLSSRHIEDDNLIRMCDYTGGFA